MNNNISKDDYEEPLCLLNMQPEVKTIPTARVIEKLDSYLEKNDYDSAKEHLCYWLSEAELCQDSRGKLAVLNEQIGLYRKTGKEVECLKTISDALSLADSMNIERSVTYATTLINAATGYKAFGKAEDALPLYQKARGIYEASLDLYDQRLAALYNNMALTLAELKSFREAGQLYNKAIEIMQKHENGEPEIAITCLNIADLIAAESGLVCGEAKIEEQLLKAEELLNTEGLKKDGYYAFVCKKCAPVFGYYGHFLTEQELNRRAKEIYERS